MGAFLRLGKLVRCEYISNNLGIPYNYFMWVISKNEALGLE